MNNEEKILGMLEALTSDMSGMKTDIIEMKDCLSNVEQSVAKANDRMINIELSVADTNDHVHKVKQSAAGLKFDIMSISSTLTDRFMNFTEKLTSIDRKVKNHEDILSAE